MDYLFEVVRHLHPILKTGINAEPCIPDPKGDPNMNEHYGDFVFHIDGYPTYLKCIDGKHVYVVLDRCEIVTIVEFQIIYTDMYGDIYIPLSGYTKPKYVGNGYMIKTMIDARIQSGNNIMSKIIVGDYRECNLWGKLINVFHTQIINVKNTNNVSEWVCLIHRPTLNRAVQCRNMVLSYERMGVQADYHLMNWNSFNVGSDKYTHNHDLTPCDSGKDDF